MRPKARRLALFGVLPRYRVSGVSLDGSLEDRSASHALAGAAQLIASTRRGCSAYRMHFQGLLSLSHALAGVAQLRVIVNSSCGNLVMYLHFRQQTSQTKECCCPRRQQIRKLGICSFGDKLRGAPGWETWLLSYPSGPDQHSLSLNHPYAPHFLYTCVE
jgi:hypothetical protein